MDIAKLPVDDLKRFDHLEKIIEKGMSHFIEVGTALMLIKQEKLYRLLFSTFEEYCRERWGFERRYAYRLIDAAKVNQNVSQGTQNLPTSERQLRPLTRLEPEQQREVWDQAVKTAPQGKVTAKHVSNIVKQVEEPQVTEAVEAVEILDVEEITETDTIKKLKLWWLRATDRERQYFLDWLKTNT